MHPHARPSLTDVRRTCRAAGLACALGALLLAGCQRGGPAVPASATSARKAPQHEAAVDPAVANANRTMAYGVTVGDSAAPVESRFDLAVAPVAGVPFTVGLAILPGAPVSVLRLEVSAEEGLAVLEPAAEVTREKVPAGSVITLPLTLQSAEAGTRVVTVKATLDLPEGPQSRTFAFPVLVGAVPAAAAPAAPTRPR